MKLPRFSVYKLNAGPRSQRWCWRLKGANGEIVGGSWPEGFATRAGAYRNAALVRRALENAMLS